MGTIALAKERISRLTGRGRTDDRGGGLPLTDLFGPILRTLLDADQPQPVETLTDAVRGSFIGRKEDRLRYMYRMENPWPSLMDDALAQLEHVDLILSVGEGWALTPEFRTDEPLTVVRAVRGHPSVIITVASEAARKARDGEELAMHVTSLATELDSQRGGLRPLDEKHVARLMESMREFGFREEFPILITKNGRLLDGRHRRAAAERLGIGPITQTISPRKELSDQEALAVAWVGNIHSPGWTPKDLDRISSALGGVSPARALGVGTRARNALLDNHRRTDAAITKEIGCRSDRSVAFYRAELISEGKDVAYDPDGEKRDRAIAEWKADPDADVREVADRAGVSVGLAHKVKDHVHEPQTADREQASEPDVDIDELSIPAASRSEPVHRPDLAPKTSPQPEPQARSTTWAVVKARMNDIDYVTEKFSSFITDPNVLVAVGHRLVKIGEQRGGVVS